MLYLQYVGRELFHGFCYLQLVCWTYSPSNSYCGVALQNSIAKKHHQHMHDFTASSLQNAMPNPIPTRLILTKITITTYRGLKARHSAEVISRGTLKITKYLNHHAQFTIPLPKLLYNPSRNVRWKRLAFWSFKFFPLPKNVKAAFPPVTNHLEMFLCWGGLDPWFRMENLPTRSPLIFDWMLQGFRMEHINDWLDWISRDFLRNFPISAIGGFVPFHENKSSFNQKHFQHFREMLQENFDWSFLLLKCLSLKFYFWEKNTPMMRSWYLEPPYFLVGRLFGGAGRYLEDHPS